MMSIQVISFVINMISSVLCDVTRINDDRICC